MTKPVLIRSSATIKEALRLMHDHNVRALVVAKCHEDGCYNVLTEQDIVYRVAALGIDPAHIRVGTLMEQANVQLVPQMSLRAAAQHLAAAEASYALVIEDSRLIGLISVTDILQQLCPDSEAPEVPLHFWRSPQQAQQTARTGAAQMIGSRPEALLTLGDDMRLGCKTMF